MSAAPVALVTPAAFWKALGWSRSSFYRALAADRLPPPTETTQGGHGRWRPEVAAEAVRAHSKPIPAEWQAIHEHAAA